MGVMVERKPKPKQAGCPQRTPHHHWKIATERDNENRSLGKCRNCGAKRWFWNGLDYEGSRVSYGQFTNAPVRVVKEKPQSRHHRMSDGEERTY